MAETGSPHAIALLRLTAADVRALHPRSPTAKIAAHRPGLGAFRKWRNARRDRERILSGEGTPAQHAAPVRVLARSAAHTRLATAAPCAPHTAPHHPRSQQAAHHLALPACTSTPPSQTPFDGGTTAPRAPSAHAAAVATAAHLCAASASSHASHTSISVQPQAAAVWRCAIHERERQADVGHEQAQLWRARDLLCVYGTRAGRGTYEYGPTYYAHHSSMDCAYAAATDRVPRSTAGMPLFAMHSALAGTSAHAGFADDLQIHPKVVPPRVIQEGMDCMRMMSGRLLGERVEEPERHCRVVELESGAVRATQYTCPFGRGSATGHVQDLLARAFVASRGVMTWSAHLHASAPSLQID
ncbi:hypothetical protein BC834DRAFT_844191 [Gloeopeniophorella convolvens]|nr:hypothetical protein BC834DRAFT_844191 [Gloeopeniophorella convolvens]